MALGKKEFAAALKHRIFEHWGTTVLGCAVFAGTVIGERLQESQEFSQQGKMLVGFSAFLAWVSLALSKGKTRK